MVDFVLALPSQIVFSEQLFAGDFLLSFGGLPVFVGNSDYHSWNCTTNEYRKRLLLLLSEDEYGVLLLRNVFYFDQGTTCGRADLPCVQTGDRIPCVTCFFFYSLYGVVMHGVHVEVHAAGRIISILHEVRSIIFSWTYVHVLHNTLFLLLAM